MSRHKINVGSHYETKEGSVMEYACRPIFWLFALFIVASLFVTIWAAHRGATPTTVPPHGSQKGVPSSLPKPKPFYTRWLAPYYLHSPLRRVAAIVLYFGVLGLQLRHGTWVLITWWRLLIELLRQRPTATFSSFGAQGSYAVSILVLLVAGVALTGFGGVVLLFQVQCLFELTLSE